MTAAPAGRSWVRALPALAPHVLRTVPWLTLLAGCVSGTALLDVTAHLLHASHATVGQNTLRFTFLSAVAAFIFVPRAPFRPVSQAVPIADWIVPTGQTLLSLPVVAATCWLQLRIIDTGLPSSARPVIYPLLAQLTAWCAIAVATATSVDRSRYADLGGAVATPLAFAVIAIAWYTPTFKAHLVTPPATSSHATIAWYAVAAVGVATTSLALRDRWHRYTKHLHSKPAA